MKKLIFIILPLFCLMLSCNSNESNTNNTTTAEIAKGAITEKPVEAQAPPVKELPKDYPASYKAAGLPVWEKTTVKRANKIQDSNYQLVLSSPEDVHSIAAFYDKEMKAKGWTANKISAEAQQKNRRTMTFKKGNNQIMINVLSIPNQKEQVITIMFPEMKQ